LASIAAVHAAAPAMPIIVLSAQNTLDTAVRASDSRAFEYFPKPFDLDELTKAVDQAQFLGVVKSLRKYMLADVVVPK
ncbi:hypothetical protein LCGC14_2964540, partial [marine sediment metagenome]